MCVSDVFVGIVLSKSELEIGLLPQSQIWTVSNDARGLTELVKLLAPLRPILVILGAVGGKEHTTQRLLEEAGLSVRLVNLYQLQDFLQESNGHALDDVPTALGLARYGQWVQPQDHRGKVKEVSELEALLVRRCQLVEMLATERKRVEIAVERVRGDIKKHIRWLEKRLKQIDQDTGSFINGMPIWSGKRKIIQIVPGAGPVWATRLLARFFDSGGLSRQWAAAAAGFYLFKTWMYLGKNLSEMSFLGAALLTDPERSQPGSHSKE